MAKSGKARKRESVTAVARTVPDTKLPARQPIARPVPRDAIRELLGSAPDPRRRPDRPDRPLVRWGIVVGVLVAVTVFGLFWAQYRSAHATSSNAAVRGHLSELGARIGGRIAAVTVDAGDRVEAGQVLVQLEDQHLRAELDEARAQVNAARAQADAARRNHTMYDNLHKLGGVSRAELSRVASERHVRDAALVAAQARVTRAETELASAAIRAPQNGSIVRRIVQPGGAIEAGQPVLSMWLGDELWVEAWIDEGDLESIRPGARATVAFHAFPDREFSGVVDRIGLATDLEMPDSALPHPRFARMRSAPVIGVRIRLEQPPPQLVPGLSATVAINRER